MSLSVTIFQPRVVKTEARILQDLGGKSSLEQEEIENLQTAISRVGAVKKITREFKLAKAASGRCVYPGAIQNEKVEIYSAKGKDLMYVQTQLGPKGILLRTFAGVQNLATGEIAVQESQPGIALAIPRSPYEDYSAGGALEFVGRADEIRVSVTNR